MTRKPFFGCLIGAALVAVPATALDGEAPPSDDYVTWVGGPCTEPVLFVETDRENVRRHIPPDYPGTDEEFMSRVVTTVGIDGHPKATVVFTLNRCRDNEITSTVDGTAQATHSATDVAEVLVMVLWDGPSSNAFEFYAFASYVDEQALAGAFAAIGLPTQMTPGLVFDLEAYPDQPEPGEVVPLHVEVPGVFRAVGTAVRPLTYGPAGHATHHYHGSRGAIWVEHDAPTGGISSAEATITVTGTDGEWLADLLGGTTAEGSGMLLEKEVGHGHTAYLAR